MRTKNKALKIARIAFGRKAEDVVILNVRKVCNFTEFFILATSQTSNQIRAVCDEVKDTMKKAEVTLVGVDGGSSSTTWRVLDYGDVIFHCFTEEIRIFYGLERLWGDAEKVAWEK